MQQRKIHTLRRASRESVASLLSRKRGTEQENNFTTHQSQLEQLADDPVKHPSVVLLVDLVCYFLDNVLRRQRRAVDLTETLGVI